MDDRDAPTSGGHPSPSRRECISPRSTPRVSDSLAAREARKGSKTGRTGQRDLIRERERVERRQRGRMDSVPVILLQARSNRPTAMLGDEFREDAVVVGLPVRRGDPDLVVTDPKSEDSVPNSGLGGRVNRGLRLALGRRAGHREGHPGASL